MKALQFILVAALATGLAIAAAETESVTIVVEGVGQDREDSIFNALASAVRQEHGTEVQSQRVVTQAESQMVLSRSNGDETTVSLSSGSEGKITSASGGLISSYRVLSSRSEGGVIRTRVRVVIPRYHGPGLRTYESRRKLAVYPFTAEPGLTLFGVRLSAVDLAEEFSQEVVEEFTRSRRFAVLERRRMNEVAAERQLIAGPEAPIVEKAKLGRALGADYVVYGKIRALDIDTSVREIAATGERYTEIAGALIVDIRVVSPATNQVHWADTLELLGSEALQGYSGTSFELARQEVIETAARRLIGASLQAIYPIRVVDAAASGDLVLNQGGTALAVGQQLDLFRYGEEVTDPYSGESLGRSETFVGRLEVVRVTNRLTYARILGNESLAGEYDNYVVRYAEDPDMEQFQVDRAAERGTRRRVLLPQDGG
jgi:TolB-like protein